MKSVSDLSVIRAHALLLFPHFNVHSRAIYFDSYASCDVNPVAFYRLRAAAAANVLCKVDQPSQSFQ